MRQFCQIFHDEGDTLAMEMVTSASAAAVIATMQIAFY